MTAVITRLLFILKFLLASIMELENSFLKLLLFFFSFAKVPSSPEDRKRDIVAAWSLLFSWNKMCGKHAVLESAMKEAAKAGVQEDESVEYLLKVIDRQGCF